jgi:uncharacterized RDD family membrane protein YckC
METPAGPERPQGPQGPQSPAPERPLPPAGPPAYGGPVPPGGWDQPPPAAWVPGAFKLAGWWSRAGAYAIDALIVTVPALIVLGALGIGIFATDGDGVGALIGAFVVMVIVFLAIAFVYAPVLMKRAGERNGQTWGKQLLGIRVIRTNGQPFTFGPAALREIVLKGLAVGVASSVIPFIPWFLNYFWPLWDDQNRALHDMAASTRVVEA